MKGRHIGCGFDSELSLSVGSVHVLPVAAWVLSGYSGFLPLSEDMLVRLTGNTKLFVGVGAHCCFSLYVGSAMCCPTVLYPTPQP